LPVVPGLLLPAEERAVGVNFAHEARWPGVGKRDMSGLISARISWAALAPMPGISSSCATW
jgi:hypothetical protein